MGPKESLVLRKSIFIPKETIGSVFSVLIPQESIPESIEKEDLPIYGLFVRNPRQSRSFANHENRPQGTALPDNIVVPELLSR